MPPKINVKWRQADFMYDLHWDAKVDNDFVDYLSFEARVGNFVWPHKVRRSMEHGLGAVNYNHNQNFSSEYGQKKLALLEKRFKTFSWMLGLEGVSYVAETNVVTAPDDVWDLILEVLSTYA